jgi:hypothetical protein
MADAGHIVEGAVGSFAAHYWPYVHDEPRVGIANGEVR